ncbi:MAG: Na/Pi cotransporter family protein [Bacteroidota bacterium]|nr:Na/Pi cotransporter family protein [Bacteroidota bacterium]
MNVIWQLLTIVGSLGVFLFGMKLMSEALQKVAGNRLRKILSSITSSRFKSIFTGFSITAGIQSSSALTVMVVSLVNAGLLSLKESAGIIMGANIGTTITAWIIALVGFEKGFSISMITLPLIALSLPLMLSPKSRLRSWAEFVMGLGILFFGLEFLKDSVPIIEQSSGFLRTFSETYGGYGYMSILLFTLIGLTLTIIFQSSSATIALTIVLAVDGWLSIDLAAAMILGENIGTTSTAYIASFMVNRTARKAAWIHIIFNIAGVFWALLFFRFFMDTVTGAVDLLGYGDTNDRNESIPVVLAMFHTLFNSVNTILLAGLIPKLVSLTGLIIKEPDEEEMYYLTYLDPNYVSTSEMSLLQAKQEIIIYSVRVHRMFEMIPKLLVERDSNKFTVLFDKIEKYEEITDNMELEIATYLTRLSEGKLSLEGSNQVRSMLKIISELERIGDTCLKMAKIIDLKNKQKLYFIPDLRQNVLSIFSMTNESLILAIDNLKKDRQLVIIEEADKMKKRINEFRDALQKNHLESLNKNEYYYSTGTVYIELISLSTRISDNAHNVSSSLFVKKPLNR